MTCQVENWFNFSQFQTNNSNCGVFAVAFAVSLALGTNPQHVTFDTSKMHSNLAVCLKAQKLSIFPVFELLLLLSDSKHLVKLLTIQANDWTENSLWYKYYALVSRALLLLQSQFPKDILELAKCNSQYYLSFFRSVLRYCFFVITTG